MKILIVDDDLVLRKSLQQQLQISGHQTLEAADGLSAFMSLKDNSDIEIIITDYRMPILGGSDWIGLLHHYHPDIPLIVASAYSFVEDKLGDNIIFLQKPFEISELKRAIDAAKSFGAQA
jgi:CheY-like chemotaxis protein